jgi:hypothetical protein
VEKGEPHEIVMLSLKDIYDLDRQWG